MDILTNNIPQELKACPNWVLWRYVERDGKKTKIPYMVNGSRAKSNDPATWTDFQTAIKAASRFDGIGFMLGNSPYIGIDIDHCLTDEQEHAVAAKIARACKTYVEKSPSGEGIHIIGRGTLAKGFRDGRIEIYPHGRYFTVTGNAWGTPQPIRDIQAQIDFLTHKQKSAAGSGAAAIVERIRHSRQGELFASLYDAGDTSRYGGDDSAADMALMNMLPFWTNGNRGLMGEIFSSSALAKREKWQQRPDYRERTIEAALKTWNGEHYRPRSAAGPAMDGGLLAEITEEQARALAYLGETDTDNAERLKIVYGDTLAYLPERGKGASWMRWDGKRWKPSYETNLYNAVSRMAAMAVQAADKYVYVNVNDKNSVKAKKAKLAFLTKTSNQHMIDSCLKRARGTFVASPTDFDQEDFLLTVQNGVLNLKTGELYPHDKKFKCSKICRAAFEKSWEDSLWAHTLDTIMPDKEEQAYLQKWAGYMLWGGAPEEKLLFLYGPGGTGKGTFINTIAYALGDYADVINVEVLLASRNDAHAGGAAASPEIAKLVGIRAAVASESGIGRKLNDAKVKNLTGNDDITARFLYGQEFTFSPQMKIILQSNYLPTLTDINDTGIRRRLVIAPFIQDLHAVRDATLKTRLKEPANLSAVLGWCFEGCIKWQADGLGEPPARFQQATKGYYSSGDTIQQFIDDECVIGEPGSKMRVKVIDLYHAYKRWLGEDLKRGIFMELMRGKGYIPHRYTDCSQAFDNINLKYDEAAFMY